LAESNPAAGGSRAPEQSRDRVLGDDELRAIWAATADDRDNSAIVRLLMLFPHGAPEHMPIKTVHARARLSEWRERALAGAATALKERERDDRDDEIARLKSKVGEITSTAHSAARPAMSSLCRCAAAIIARSIAVVMRPHGGRRPALNARLLHAAVKGLVHLGVWPESAACGCGSPVCAIRLNFELAGLHGRSATQPPQHT
jgi:hypothetical protein